jgi:FSR family fosmidomycin resistance protein-like MFS transporter
MAVLTETSGSDAKVMGVLGAGHFFSHFYLLCLPPLFPALRTEFGASYAALGFMMTSYNLIGGIIQAPMGFLIDRFGARWILIAGVVLMSASVLLMGVAGSYEAILVLAVLAGLGNSVIHPADYAVMSGAISQGRLGRAFSLHTFSGEFGGAFAPVIMGSLAAMWDWRSALIAAGCAGLVVAALMASQSRLLVDDSRGGSQPAADGKATGMKLLMSPAMLLFFAFFVAISLAGGGMQAFAITSLIQTQEITLAGATMALTVFLFSSSIGVLLGGPLADRVKRQEMTMMIAVAIAAGFVLLPAFLQLSNIALFAILALAGLAQGVTRPARDMMVRAATPPGQSGKVFGFVSVGLSVGSSVSPLLFGWVMDQGAPSMIFVLTAGFMMLMLATSLAAHFTAKASAGR